MAPKFTSYVVAPLAVQESVTAGTETPLAPVDGDGEFGVSGGGGSTIARGPAETLSNDAAVNCAVS